MTAVPAFSLYGEQEDSPLGGWLHSESIPARSGRYAWEIRPHRHPHLFQILHVSGGSGECLLDGVRTPLRPGAVVTVAPGAVHGFRFSSDVDGWVLTVQRHRAVEAMGALPGLAERLSASRVAALSDADAPCAVQSAFRIIDAELAASRAGRDALIAAQLGSLLVLIDRSLGGAPAGGPAAALRRHAERFRDLVNAHFRAERSAGFYADRLGVSETHLNRICRAVLGRSARGVIHARLLAEASRDLAFTTLSVQEIGHSLGFEDPAYFSRFFTKASGRSPRCFRQEATQPPAVEPPSRP